MRDPVVTRARAGITERDLDVLRWAGEMYAAPMRTVARLVGSTSTPASAEVAARRVAARLGQLGYADRRPLWGTVWLVPTRRGLRAAGLDYRVWEPAEHEWGAKHVALAGLLRIHLDRTYPDAWWESERAIRSRWQGTGARTRLADGGLEWPDGVAVGIELERFVKRPSRYRGAVMDVDPAWTDGVWWFTPGGQVPLLTARLKEAGGGDRHQVYALPPEVAL